MEGEIWRDIEGYEGHYQISSFGRVKSSKRNKFLKLLGNGDGYLKVILSKNSAVKNFKIHRLVAIAFIPNPENKEEVNHKDGDKLNNKVENLEWVTRLENHLHAIKKGLNKQSKGEDNPKTKKVINIITNELFLSTELAAKSIGFSTQRLRNMLNNNQGRRNSTNFRYY